jgi:Zn-dependent peptidase ImmA (M78 family)
MLLEMGLLESVERREDARTPKDHSAAERMAQTVRHSLGLDSRPVDDLGEVCERLGLFTYSASLGSGGPDGGCVEISDAVKTLGAAVINGDAPPGRRRMTLAHELGHWLCGDAYDAQASVDAERMINSFAIHLLAPRSGIQSVWNSHAFRTPRDRALAVGATFRLSWSATVGQLRNVSLIDQDEYDRLSSDDPRAGDYMRLGLSWAEELGAPYVCPGFASACLNGYVSDRLTASRVVELLRGILAENDFPQPDPLSINDLRGSFTGHGD